MTKKHISLGIVGLMLIVVGEIVRTPEFVSGFISGAGIYFAVWAMLGDILNGIAITKREVTTINTQDLKIESPSVTLKEGKKS